MENAKLAATVQVLEGKLQYAQRELAKFESTFKRSPLYALEWSQDMFRAAAMVQIVEEALAFLREPTATEAGAVAFRNSCGKRAMHAARYPGRSSSTTANLADAARGEVYAELYEDLAE